MLVIILFIFFSGDFIWVMLKVTPVAPEPEQELERDSFLPTTTECTRKQTKNCGDSYSN